ncbi:hypothetical protein JRO89_XS12G0252800 [Xanthoceras sorbifolium]|uniref:non-specific serine/threonine protein kinase n=1 Tax=Xanthoceras sorbifolium TaxID=99658 RepID=A0ABQ8HDQ8_9ROSI|nr:hypothetical protein JRO89_XS12G0252800 [Xanthoceras sorbifolium]
MNVLNPCLQMAWQRVYLIGTILALSSFDALQAVRRKLKDTRKKLNNWKKTDPCASNWTGVICMDSDDGYLHVQELRLLNMNLSGKLAPELGQLSHMTILDVMWNNISGSIPKEIGNLASLKLLLLSGNQLSGPLPDELGFLSNLTTFNLEQNQISGPLPKSFADLQNAKHFHLNDNNISGQIPPELSSLRQLVHLLLDNNNLSGHLPPELSKMPNLTIIQLDNNNFQGTTIPDSYNNMPKLLKLSLRNCSLQGKIPDLSSIPGLLFLDLSSNQLNGSIPTNKLSENITTIVLSNNKLIGPIPSNFSGLPHLQRLSLENNALSGNVPSDIWQNINFSATATLTLDFQNNSLTNISGSLNPPANVSMRLEGNPVCSRANELNVIQLCGLKIGDDEIYGSSNDSNVNHPLELDYFCEVQAYPIFVHTFIDVLEPLKSVAKIPIKAVGVKGFSFIELEEATSGFSVTTQVGQGGYGKVYKGILANGTVVAIKRAQQGSLQGEKEFLTEIELLSRLHHRNLVSLVGYCDEEAEQMLVYEFMPHGSLQDILNDQCLCLPTTALSCCEFDIVGDMAARLKDPLSFSMRLHIALGSAKGILYLHTEADPPIIHRDIKANNILLDFKFTAKVSDFGISRLAPVPNVRGDVGHVSTVVRGTPGYLDPEYFLTHQLTEKSDVYSLGIVFLELLTGMQPISRGRNIVREVNAACRSGLMFSIIDKSMGPYSSECLKRFMTLAVKCCEDDREARPSMLEVVRELENISSLLPPEADTIPTESDVSASSEMSGIIASSTPYSRRSLYASDGLLEVGSELVSGVIPTIKPR